MTDKDKKKTRGRPVKNGIKPIPEPAEKIAKAIFFAGDKKIVPLPNRYKENK